MGKFVNINDLIKNGQIVKENTSKVKLAEFIEFAENEIAAARFNLAKFPLTAYKSAYDALIHAGNALIRFHGYRPTAKFTHVTITEFVDRVLGKEYGHLARSFKHMRRKRHPMQYEARFSESRKEVHDSIIKAEQLIKQIKGYIDIKPTQRRFF